MAEMIAGAALARAAVAALRGLEGLAQVADGKPIQASVPYLVVDAGGTSDWGCKEAVGREIQLTLTLHDAGEDRTRLREVGARADGAMMALPREIGGWRVVSFVFQRSREVATPGGGALLLEYRARVLEV